MLTREQRADIERRLLEADKQLGILKRFRAIWAEKALSTPNTTVYIDRLTADRSYLRTVLQNAYIADVAELAAVEADGYRVDTASLTAAINDAIARELRKQRLTQQIADALAQPQRRGFLKLAEVE